MFSPIVDNYGSCVCCQLGAMNFEALQKILLCLNSTRCAVDYDSWNNLCFSYSWSSQKVETPLSTPLCDSVLVQLVQPATTTVYHCQMFTVHHHPIYICINLHTYIHKSTNTAVKCMYIHAMYTILGLQYFICIFTMLVLLTHMYVHMYVMNCTVNIKFQNCNNNNSDIRNSVYDIFFSVISEFRFQLMSAYQYILWLSTAFRIA